MSDAIVAKALRTMEQTNKADRELVDSLRSKIDRDGMSEERNTKGAALDESTRLAFERTRIAYERTMLSWVRTATSLITFGFSIYKFFQMEFPSGRAAGRLIGPREFAMSLVGIGLFLLALASFEYRQNIRMLASESGGRSRSMAVFAAALISALGILAFLAIIFRQ